MQKQTIITLNTFFWLVTRKMLLFITYKEYIKKTNIQCYFKKIRKSIQNKTSMNNRKKSMTTLICDF